MDKIRAEFEAWIMSPPYEHMCDRNSDNSAWPGAYKRYETELAWDAWQAALSQQVEEPVNGCILCANGNDLPEGEYCRGCGRENNLSPLGSAVRVARGSESVPSVKVEFASSQDGWTFDELDLRGPGDFMTTPPEGWESSDWRTCLELKAELHNKKVYRAEIKRLRALIANRDSAESVQQDVEEFIRHHGYERAWNSYTEHCVSQGDLRAWMAGHVRVPDGYVDAAEKTIRAICINAVEKLNDLAPDGGWDRGEVVAEMYIKPLRAMLIASKEKREDIFHAALELGVSQ